MPADSNIESIDPSASTRKAEIVEIVNGRQGEIVEAVTTASTAEQVTTLLKDTLEAGVNATKQQAANWLGAVPGSGLVEQVVGNNPILAKVVDAVGKRVGLDLHPQDQPGDETSLVKSAAKVVPFAGLVKAQVETYRIAAETIHHQLGNAVEIGRVVADSPEAEQAREALSAATTKTVEATKARINDMKGLASSAAAKLLRKS